MLSSLSTRSAYGFLALRQASASFNVCVAGATPSGKADEKPVRCYFSEEASRLPPQCRIGRHSVCFLLLFSPFLTPSPSFSRRLPKVSRPLSGLYSPTWLNAGIKNRVSVQELVDGFFLSSDADGSVGRRPRGFQNAHIDGPSHLLSFRISGSRLLIQPPSKKKPKQPLPNAWRQPRCGERSTSWGGLWR